VVIGASYMLQSVAVITEQLKKLLEMDKNLAWS
jgi:hypothetical protein